MSLNEKSRELIFEKCISMCIRLQLEANNEVLCAESEIEKIMVVAFLLEHLERTTDTSVAFYSKANLRHEDALKKAKKYFSSSVDLDVVFIWPQVLINSYRVDFMAYGVLPGREVRVGALAIECDGHDFHERTKEQARRDKSRDRALVSAGIPVMRFTGSEIFENPQACAMKAISYFSEVRRIEDERDYPPSYDSDANIPF